LKALSSSPVTARQFNSLRPQNFFLERERAQSGEIVSVATLFLTNRECPWRCVYCDLWKNTTMETVPSGAIPAQIDYALREIGEPARQIKLYNAGSFFDPNAIPPEDFPAIVERLRGFESVIVECHPALVGPSAEAFRTQLTHHTPHAKLEVAMGLEIADDAILAKLNKRMTLAMFKSAAAFLHAHGIALRVFVMVKPPFVQSEDEALDFARRSIDFAFDCGATAASLIPARFGPDELESLAQRGDFAPPKLATLETALDYGVALRRGRVFADLWDLEQLADCQECFSARRARLERINFEQKFAARAVCESCQARPQ
jgi:radical SAM enzyme (TIGR01210 family)